MPRNDEFENLNDNAPIDLSEFDDAFNRVASVIGRYEYQRTDRNETDGDFDAHEVSVRFRLQR